jgi:hypothetical protein
LDERLFRTSQPLFALGNLANALLQLGEVAEARERLATFLDLSRSSEWEGLDIFSDIFALLAAKEGRFEAAARLMGFADAASRRMKFVRQANEERACEIASAAVRGALDTATIERLMAEGRSLDGAGACEIVLGDEGK